MINTKANSALLKDVNRKKILKVIEETGRLSRVEIKNILKIDGKTVTNIANGLIADGLLVSTGDSSYTGGRRRDLLTLNSEYGYLIGIHLGVYFIRGILTDFKYNIVAEIKTPITPKESKVNLISKIKKTLQFLAQNKNIKKEKILGIGFAANGFYNFETGWWIDSVNNMHWKNVEIKKILKEQLDVPIYLENSSRVMTLAEERFGGAKKKENFIYIELGEGIGCGIIISGRLYRGANSIAGELGHTIVVPNGQLCSCGNRGCLETVASGWAINKLIKEKISDGAKSEIIKFCDDNLDNINTDMVFKAFRNGDKLATEVLEMATDYLSIGIANLVNLFNPNSIFMGGHFATLGSSYLTKTKDKIKKYTMPLVFRNVEILTTSLDNSAAVMGVTTLVRDPYFYIDKIQ